MSAVYGCMTAPTLIQTHRGALEAPSTVSLLTTSAAAATLGISKRSLQELVSDRKIGFIKFGRNIRFSQSDLERFIETHRTLPTGWKANNTRKTQ